MAAVFGAVKLAMAFATPTLDGMVSMGEPACVSVGPPVTVLPAASTCANRNASRVLPVTPTLGAPDKVTAAPVVTSMGFSTNAAVGGFKPNTVTKPVAERLRLLLSVTMSRNWNTSDMPASTAGSVVMVKSSVSAPVTVSVGVPPVCVHW